MNKMLVICGPTATGKTDVGVKLASIYNGEIISADSRQVYKGMDIITGKDLPENAKINNQNERLSPQMRDPAEAGQIKYEKFSVGYRVKDGIPVWLVDIVEPNYPFNIGEYSQLAKKVIKDVWSRNKLPIVVGGSGLYIKSITDPIGNIIIPPNNKLRKSLEGLSVELLQEKTREVNFSRWEKMNDSDRANPRRLVRVIEIATWRKNSSLEILPQQLDTELILYIGLRTTNKILFERIDRRVEKRINEGVLDEVKKLMGRKYTSFLHAFSATGFVNLSNYINGEEGFNDAIESWKFKEKKYAASQIMWFKKDKRIIWFDIAQSDYYQKIEDTVRKWYTSVDANKN